MSWLVDASVALKWVLEEEHTDLAQALIGHSKVTAPDFILLECANVLTRQVRRGEMDATDAADRHQLIELSIPRFIPLRPHLREAQRLSLLLRHSAYDCLYLATAMSEGLTLITADEKFATLVETRFPLALRRLSASGA